MNAFPAPLTSQEALTLLRHAVLLNGEGSATLTRQQLMQLLCARKRALAEDDRAMDSLLFELGKLLDEQIRDGAPAAIKKRFDLLTDSFHKLELGIRHLGHLAFMGSGRLDLAQLVELKQDMEWFEALHPGFFQRLVLDDLLKSPLLDSYGRRRVKLLVDGLDRVQTVKTRQHALACFDLQAIQAIIQQLETLEKEERLFMQLAEIMAEQVKQQQHALTSPPGRELLKRLTTIELRRRHGVEGDIPDSLFNKAFDLIKLEAIYTNVVLPQALQGNRTLRQEFIAGSGLDLFYLEELEEQYCASRALPADTLSRLRSAEM